MSQAKARIPQAKAAAEAYNRRIAVQKANLVHNNDVLSKTEYRAPFDGVVTNLPVREGETVVVGIQNSPGSTLMTLADTSVITAEVMVDETDIVNVKLGQPAEVSIDAIPKKKFKGTVTDIGDNALVRSTGVATSQSTEQFAGGQGLQGGGDPAGGAGESAAGTVGDGEDHHGEQDGRAVDSDPGADHPAAGRPGAEERQERGAGGGEARGDQGGARKRCRACS